MKAQEIYNAYVTGYNNIKDHAGEDVTIRKIIEISTTEKMKQIAEQVRQAPTSSIQEIKASLVPAFTPSGTFGGGHRLSNMKTINNIVVVDIDIKPEKGENAHLEDEDMLTKTRADIFADESVVWMNTSISGHGLMVCVAVDDVTSIDTLFPALVQHYKDNYNVDIDTACKDICRCRYIAPYDGMAQYKANNAEIKPFSEHIERETYTREQVRQEQEMMAKKPYMGDIDEKFMEACIRMCVKMNLINVADYNTWIKLGWACTCLTDGESLFHEISRDDSSWCGEDKFKEKWRNLVSTSTTTIEDLAFYCGMLKGAVGKGWCKMAHDYAKTI